LRPRSLRSNTGQAAAMAAVEVTFAPLPVHVTLHG